MPRILVAIHNEKVGHFVASALREHRHVVDECWTGADALRQLDLAGPHLLVAVVDAALGDMDGFAVSSEARRRGVRTLILMLGATESVKERVRGFTSGADDFLSKPFVMDELLARVHALLRRSVGHRPIVCGELEVDLLTGRATLAGQELHCTARELAVLVYLAEHRDEPVTRLELLAAVWGSSFDPSSNAIHVLLTHLRGKLGGYAWMIETIRGKGYRLRSQRDVSPRRRTAR
jgi:DNA-binding response OmpR family regulator